MAIVRLLLGDLDHVATVKEVGPAVHLRGLNTELRENRGDLRAMLGAVVDGLEQQQRAVHEPGSLWVVPITSTSPSVLA